MSDRSKSSPDRYDLVAQGLHWGMAAILLYLVFSSGFEDVPDTEMAQRIRLHAGLGLFAGLLGVIRFVWRRWRPRPAETEGGPGWRRAVAKTTVNLFYALFLLMPAVGVILAGLVAYPVRPFGGVDISGWLTNDESAAALVNSVHGFLADTLLAFVALHVGAALYHHFVKRDGLLWRMTPLR